MQKEMFDKPDMTQSAGGGFEGASRLNTQLALWSPPLQSADAQILPDKDTLDARAQDLQRNDGYIHGAVQGQKDSIVGAFYRLNAQPDYEYLGLDEEWAEAFQKAVESRFNLVSESSSCWLDASGKLTFSEMIRLGLGVAMLSGENLATVEWLKEGGRPFKTAIQMIDPIRLDNPTGALPIDGWRKGVKVNKYGRPLKYAIRKSIQGDYWNFHQQFDHTIVDAKKPWGRKQVLHYFEPHRIDQSRGISDLVAILKQSKMVGKYQDIVLQNAVLGATYAAAIESDLPSSEAFETMGAGDNSMNAWAANYLSAINAYTGDSKNMHIDGLKIPHLYPGTKLKLMSAGQPGGIGTNYEESLLRHLAAGLGMSYEEFSHDFTKTNYSSARAAMGQTQKGMQSKKKTHADKFATDIYGLWFEEQMNAGEFDDVLPKNAPNFYEKLNRDAYLKCKWIGAARGQIDELKETNAAIARIAAGLSTYEKECARFGDDFRDVLKQRVREQKMMDDMGLRVSLGAGNNLEEKSEDPKDSKEDKEKESKDDNDD